MTTSSVKGPSNNSGITEDPSKGGKKPGEATALAIIFSRFLAYLGREERAPEEAQIAGKKANFEGVDEEEKAEMREKESELAKGFMLEITIKLPQEVKKSLSELSKCQITKLESKVYNLKEAYLALGINCFFEEHKRQVIRSGLEGEIKRYIESNKNKKDRESFKPSQENGVDVREIDSQRRLDIASKIIVQCILKLSKEEQNKFNALSEAQSIMEKLIDLIIALEDLKLFYEDEIVAVIRRVINQN